MRLTVSAKPVCSCPAFWQCAVTQPTMRCAGLEPADHLVGAALDPAFTSTFTVFGAETLATITSGAIQHGALLLLFPTTKYSAMLVQASHRESLRLIVINCSHTAGVLAVYHACVRPHPPPFP